MSKPVPYTIKIEDTLESIAAKLGIAPDEVIEYHNKNSNTKTNIKHFTLEGEILLTPPQEEIEVFQAQKAQQEEAKKEEKAEEEKKQQESARSEHDKKHFVVHKATCFCDQSQVPKKPATLLVTTHDKVILNDQEGKFFATEADKTFDPANATFGNCLKQPTSGGYKPCTLTPAPKWDKTFDKTKVYGKTVLTEISTLQCVAFGGKIEVLTHGQTDSVMTEHAENTNPAELALIDPALNMPPEKIKYPSVSSITLKKVENNPHFKVVSSAEKKTVEKVMIRTNQECTFEAKIKEGNVALTSWVIYNGFSGDKNKKLLTTEQVGTNFKNSFSALGKYRVEGYGKPKKEEYKNGTHDKNYPDCSIDVEVVLNKLEGDLLETIGGEDFAKVVGGKMRLRQNFPASFKAKFLLPATEEELEHLNMYVTDEAGSIIDSVKVNNTVSFTPKNKKATYHIKAEYRTESGEVQTQSFTGETINNMISAITSKFEKIRPGTPMSFKVTESTFSLYIPDENSAIANEIRSIKWNLDGRLMGTGYEITIPGHDLMTKGPHVVEAFVNLSNAHGQISKDEADDWRFEVLDNDVQNFVYDLEPKVGKTTQLNANLLIFPDLLANEQIQWDTKVPHKTIDKRTIAITPTLPGIQKVNCNINGQAGKTLTINVKQAKITGMLFTDNNGIVIQKASWGQTVNIWLEQEYLIGEKLAVEIYDKDTFKDDYIEVLNPKYDGKLISLELSNHILQKAGSWAKLYIKVGALNLKLGNANGIYESSTTLDVENKREIYAAHIGSQDGKDRHYHVDYNQISHFYGKSRGIKETEVLKIFIYEKDKALFELNDVKIDNSGAITATVKWNDIKQKLNMRTVYAVVKDSNNEVLHNGSLGNGNVAVTKKSALLGLAEYKSAVWVEKTESAVNKNGTCECESYNLYYGKKITCAFRKKVMKISKELWPNNYKEMANGLMAVMHRETSGSLAANQLEGYRSLIPREQMNKDSFAKINPTNNNQSSRAVGLIQFTQNSLVQMKEFENGDGFNALHTLKLSYAKMTEVDQLDKVKKYMQSVKTLPKVPEDIYIAVFAPDYVSQRDATMYRKGTNDYVSNASLDKDNNGIQIKELLSEFNDSLKGGEAFSTYKCENSNSDSKINAKDLTTYHIYNDGKIEKHIPKIIKAGFEKKYKYVYHDKNNIENDICTVDWIEVNKRNNGIIIQSIPSGYTNTYEYPRGGNAQTAYVYTNGDICVEGTRYGKRKYSKGMGKVELVRMKDSLSYDKNGVKIYYSFKNSQRRYCNPDTYAAFIGALAQINRTDVLCTGMCFEDATSYPSITHPNGDSADTEYYPTLEEEQVKADAFKKFHFEHIYRGGTGWYPNITGTSYSDGHEDHLHAGDFNSNIIQIINEK